MLYTIPCKTVKGRSQWQPKLLKFSSLTEGNTHTPSNYNKVFILVAAVLHDWQKKKRKKMKIALQNEHSEKGLFCFELMKHYRLFLLLNFTGKQQSFPSFCGQ